MLNLVQCLCVHTKPHEALTGIWSVFFLFFFLICLPMARKWYLFQLFSKENWCETFFQAFPQFSFYIGVKVVFPVWYERVCWSFSVLNYQEPRYAPPEIWCWNQWAHKPMHGSAVQLLTFKLLIQVNPELSWYGKLVICFFFHVFFLCFWFPLWKNMM